MGFFHCTGARQPDNRPAMKILPALATFCALALPGALLADTFEGKIGISMTSQTAQGPQSMNMSVKEGYTRFDIDTARGSMGMIRDMKNKVMIILMPQQRMYMVHPIDQPGQMPQQYGQAPQGEPHPQSTLQETGVKETILGYVCTKYVVTGQDGTAQIWVTDELGNFMGLPPPGGPMARAPQAPSGWEQAIKGRNLFPMRVISNNSKGTFKFEVTSVEKTSLPDSLFAPPEGWRKFDMGAMMGGGFPGGMPASRPGPGEN
jgi:hypothetical protein